MLPTKSLNSSCAQVQTQHITNHDHDDAERKVQLKQQLKLAELQINVSKTGVRAEQLQQLENVLLEADDVFALDEYELNQYWRSSTNKAATS